MTRTQIRLEELLIMLVYAIDLLGRPSAAKAMGSYESWLRRQGLWRQVRYLETQDYLLRTGQSGDWVWRLTERARRVVQGPRDPWARWQRSWDGWWRQIVFDLPARERRARSALLRWLHRAHFGHLQDSVWISPDPVRDVARAVRGYREDAAAFTILESRCVRGFPNRALVETAWWMEELDERYEVYLEGCQETERETRWDRLAPHAWLGILRSDQIAWESVFGLDPLLPTTLWPRGYKGPQAWRARERLRRRLAGAWDRTVRGDG